MTVPQRLLVAADLLALLLLLGFARGMARMFLPPDVPTPLDQFAKLALLFVGPPLVVVALGLSAALRWRRSGLVTALLALPSLLVGAGLSMMLS